MTLRFCDLNGYSRYGPIYGADDGLRRGPILGQWDAGVVVRAGAWMGGVCWLSFTLVSLTSIITHARQFD
jgi:hypothetical protein